MPPAVTFPRGFKSGKLTVMAVTDLRGGGGSRLWSCICDCGCHALVTASALRGKSTLSCGCLRANGEPTADRFWRNVYPDPNSGCFIWGGDCNEWGYGSIRIGDKKYAVHRVAWMLAGNPMPPEEIKLLHSCDLPSCVNIRHLRIGTIAENGADMAIRCRGSKSKKGLPYGVFESWGRYASAVRILNKLHFLGTYATAEEASAIALDFKMRTRLRV